MPTTPRTVLTDVIPERTTQKFTAVIKDENGAAIPAASLTTLTLTLYALDGAQAGTVINSVDDMNILNANRGTVDGSGNLTLLFVPNDMAILDATLLEERHVALIEWTYASGAKSGRHEIQFRVKNLDKVS